MITPPGSLGLRGRQGCPAALAPPVLGARAGLRLLFAGGGDGEHSDFTTSAFVLGGWLAQQ
jgi:hypothetical protein